MLQQVRQVCTFMAIAIANIAHKIELKAIVKSVAYTNTCKQGQQRHYKKTIYLHV